MNNFLAQGIPCDVDAGQGTPFQTIFLIARIRIGSWHYSVHFPFITLLPQ